MVEFMKFSLKWHQEVTNRVSEGLQEVDTILSVKNNVHWNILIIVICFRCKSPFDSEGKLNMIEEQNQEEVKQKEFDDVFENHNELVEFLIKYDGDAQISK